MSDKIDTRLLCLNINTSLPKVIYVSFVWVLAFHAHFVLTGPPPTTMSQPATDPKPRYNAPPDKDSIFEDLDSKLILVIIAVLFFILVIVVLVLVCWKCWCQYHSSPCKPRSGHCACSLCASAHNLRAHPICTSSQNEGGQAMDGIQTIYDPRGFCRCMMRHGCDMQMSQNRTPPPSYPSGLTVSDVHAFGREVEQTCRRGRETPAQHAGNHQHQCPPPRIACTPTQTQQTEAHIPTSLSDSVRTDVSVPLTSHVQDDVTRLRPSGNDVGFPDNLMRSSLASSRTSNLTSDVVFYSPTDDNVLLAGSQVPTRFQQDVTNAPLNIECPGLFEMFPRAVRDLFVPAERSEKRTVAGKLVVSLAREVDHRGDILVLDNMGISLQIPPGAIAYNQKQLVCLVLNWDLTDFPPMDNRQALISPVVYCGPHGLKLEKPCILSYRHCAFDPRMIQVLSSQTELIDQKDWDVMCSDEGGSGTFCATTDECQIRLKHFSLFTSVQTPPEGTTGKKWLQVAAFCAPLQHEVHHYQVRVYFLNKTPCALQWAIQNEAKFGFRLACPERSFLFEGSGEDMHLAVGYISRGWCAIKDDHHHQDQGEDCDRVSFHSVWHGKCPYISFCFKRICISDEARIVTPDDSTTAKSGGVTSSTAVPGKLQPHVSEINLDFSIFQDSGRNNPDHMNILLTEGKDAVTGPSHTNTSAFPKLAEEDENVPGCSQTRYFPTCDKHEVSISMPGIPVETGTIVGKVKINPNAPGSSVLVDFERERDCTELLIPTAGREAGDVFPHELKLKLRLKLDPVCVFGNDWRMLASMVGLDSCIPWLTTQDSPTMKVLTHMENRKMDLACLHRFLHEMGRLDAASIVDDVLRKRNVFREMSEGVEHADDGSALH
ncbi:hypothetical protein BaRGS_00029659 [Batillaria attramentaria]|uniref:Netrin receptor UNC5 n=1 Tax=Batillaria attramentaria TaxID=370345 RepID=A0ABD0JVR0_9CAEN